MMSTSPQLDQLDAIVSKREIGALKSAVAVSSHASPIIQNAGHVAIALGIAMRASIRPNVHDRLPLVVRRPERWNQLRPAITVGVEKKSARMTRLPFCRVDCSGRYHSHSPLPQPSKVPAPGLKPLPTWYVQLAVLGWPLPSKVSSHTTT